MFYTQTASGYRNHFDRSTSPHSLSKNESKIFGTAEYLAWKFGETNFYLHPNLNRLRAFFHWPEIISDDACYKVFECTWWTVKQDTLEDLWNTYNFWHYFLDYVPRPRGRCFVEPALRSKKQDNKVHIIIHWTCFFLS